MTSRQWARIVNALGSLEDKLDEPQSKELGSLLSEVKKMRESGKLS